MNTMWKKITTAGLLAFILTPTLALSEDVKSVGLKLPPYFSTQTCKTPVWKNTEVIWTGVRDLRAQKEVGSVNVRGKQETSLVASPQIEAVFDAALKDLFTTCGLKLKTVSNPQNEKGLKIGVEIQEFHADLNKKYVTSEASGKARLTVTLEGEKQKKVVEIGYSSQNKSVRIPGDKAVENTLAELFEKTLEQVPHHPQFKTLE